MKKLLLIFALLLVGALFTTAAKADNYVASQAATAAIMQNLNLDSDSMPKVDSLTSTTTGSTDFIKIQLSYPDLPPIHIFLRGPQGFYQRQDQSIRTLFLATGFFTGADSTLLLGDVANTVFVGFDYPYQIADIMNDPGKLLQTFRITPGQMALSLKWLSQQAWACPEQLSVMGVSLGGLFLPTALHIAQHMDVMIGHTVFAFTGADVHTILENNLKGQVPDFALPFLLFTIPAVNLLNDPQLHLPFLKGSFLVIYADEDQIIPNQTSEALFQLLPDQKKKVILHGNHIDVDKPELIQQTKDAVMKWLL